MEKRAVLELKKKLEKEKSSLKKDLLSFASENKKVPNDYKSRYPFTAGSSDTDDQAREVETYHGRLAIEHALETRLKEVDSALERIENGTYGLCQKCKNEIETRRLSVNPAAPLCLNCKETKK